MEENEFDLDLEELSSAEDFLEYFAIAYDPAIVHVNRLHILQRFHDYINELAIPTDEVQKREIYSRLLNNAYNDFVSSDALTEKVFKVFRLHEPVSVEVPLTDLTHQVVPVAS